MKIGELGSHQVVTISPGASIVEAARLMREHHVGDVVVVAQKGERIPIGLLTDRDIVIAAVAQDVKDLSQVRVETVASKELVTAEADDEVEEVIRTMLAQGVRRVPVVNSLGALVGIVTYDDLVTWMADELADFARLFAKQRSRERGARK